MTPVRRNQNSWLPSIFNDFFERDWPDRHSTTSPAVNILENETCYKVEVAAPGMTKEDFKVHLNEDNELLITLEKRTEPKETERAEKTDEAKKETYLRREFSYTQFRQSLLLPDNIERHSEKAHRGDDFCRPPDRGAIDCLSACRALRFAEGTPSIALN